MRTRAATILIEDNAIALIERHRTGMHYFTFPGGGMEDGETPEQSAIREMHEETGLHVEIVRMVAEVSYRGNRQFFYLVKSVGGVFGTGSGAEYTHPQVDNFHAGTYQPVWMPLGELLSQNVLPHSIAVLSANSIDWGWPKPIPVFEET